MGKTSKICLWYISDISAHNGYFLESKWEGESGVGEDIKVKGNRWKCFSGIYISS